MKVFEISNITVKENGSMYKITANDGYCIHLPEHEEFIYKRVIILNSSYNFSLVEVVAVEDLPEGAEIL